MQKQTTPQPPKGKGFAAFLASQGLCPSKWRHIRPTEQQQLAQQWAIIQVSTKH